MITQARLKELMSYDMHTGEFIWLVRRKGVKLSDPRAGCISQHRDRKYKRIRIDGILYHAHRLAWLYLHGSFPDGCIDHQDGNGLINGRHNIRSCNQTQNCANAKKRIDNTSGYKGVSKSARCSSWKVQISIDKKNRYIASFPTAEQAAIAYDEIAFATFGEFARTNKSLGLLP